MSQVVSRAVSAILVTLILSVIGMFAFAYAAQALALYYQTILAPPAAFALTAATLVALAFTVWVSWCIVSSMRKTRSTSQPSLNAMSAARPQGAAPGRIPTGDILAALHTTTAAQPGKMLIGAALVGLAAGLAPDQMRKVVKSVADLQKS